MSRRWLSERKHDPYHRMAKERGYRSRAAFKLKHLNDRFEFLKEARFVLDLGAAPGGWLQIVLEEVSKDSLVVGIDLEGISSLDEENVVTIVGDIMDERTIERIRDTFPGPIDVVLSDMAPNISGIWEVDHLRQIDLARKALEVALKFLNPKGWTVLKVFQGSDYDRFRKEVEKSFAFVKVFKPRSSRKKSAELYLVARFPKRPCSGRRSETHRRL
jgi:23S rRNA (uridine2552-2'-O)-methyltransferase